MSDPNRRLAGRSVAIVFGLALVAALTILRASDPYPLVSARETVFDYYQQLKPRAEADLPVVIVDIDDDALAEYGQWPWPRDLMATLTRRLGEMGAAAIAFDILFSEPDRTSPSRVVAGAADFDADFASALANYPSVLGVSERTGSSPAGTIPARAGVAVSGSDPTAAIPQLRGVSPPLPALAGAAAGLGAITLGQDDAGTVVRNLPLIWQLDGTIVPALAIEALRVAATETTLVVFGDTGEAGIVESLRVGQWTIPTDATGALRLYYRHLGEETYISARDVLAADAAMLAGRVAEHIVLVGTSASGLLDIRRSALGEAVPGVSVHAQALEQVLSGTYLYRADWVGGLEILVFLAVGLALVLAVALAGPKGGLAISLVAAAAATVASWLAFADYRVLLDPSFLLLGGIIVYAAMAFFRFAVTDADRRRMRNAFAHYVAPSVLVEIERNASTLQLGGEMRDLTVMFSDVRNYTAISERTRPEDLLRLLNSLFDAMGRCITREQGTIDKFMGDAIMAFWNAPLDVAAHPERACRTALAMRVAVAELNASHTLAVREPIAIGIGIATGQALVGNMGSHDRFDYSCVGDTVNIASRIEEACKHVHYDILVSQATADAFDDFALLPAGHLNLKGVSERQPVYLLVGDAGLARSSEFRTLAERHDHLLAGFGGSQTAGTLDECRSLAAHVEPGLIQFYQELTTRADDLAGIGIAAMNFSRAVAEKTAARSPGSRLGDDL